MIYLLGFLTGIPGGVNRETRGIKGVEKKG
jgi:hypothetical protein